MPLNLNVRCANGSMFQYLVPITNNTGINTFSCRTSRDSVTWETQTWKRVNGTDNTGTKLSPTVGFCGHNNKFLGSHFMTEWLLPSSPQRIPDQTMRKKSVPPVFELSCAPTSPTIINHTGAHPCSRHSRMRTGLTCANQQQLSKHGVTAYGDISKHKLKTRCVSGYC